ncbi:hypothetical protein MRX96_029892 [Rhipicephalus microplus]
MPLAGEDSKTRPSTARASQNSKINKKRRRERVRKGSRRVVVFSVAGADNLGIVASHAGRSTPYSSLGRLRRLHAGLRFQPVYLWECRHGCRLVDPTLGPYPGGLRLQLGLRDSSWKVPRHVTPGLSRAGGSGAAQGSFSQRICRPKCNCKPGLIRATRDGPCVPRDQCAPTGGQGDQCKRNEEFRSCGSACPAVCGQQAPEACTAQCVPGCFCVRGYIRDKNGLCIPTSACRGGPRGQARQAAQHHQQPAPSHPLLLNESQEGRWKWPLYADVCALSIELVRVVRRVQDNVKILF